MTQIRITLARTTMTNVETLLLSMIKVSAIESTRKLTNV